MDQADREIPEINSEQMPFSAEEWAQTPGVVQEFVLSLIMRLQALETEVADLREQLNRNSRNSSQPPSNDGPDVPPASQGAKSERKCGEQSGHKGTTRKLVPLEQVKASHDLKPEICRGCGQTLTGEDPTPYRHHVTEIPPAIAKTPF